MVVFGLSSAICQEQSKTNGVVVLVKYKTQPSKSSEALVELKKLIEKVKQEQHFVTIKLHVDQVDDSNILLYEKWADESYYKNQHMKTEHLQQFINKSREFLAGPPEISFWKLDSEYE